MFNSTIPFSRLLAGCLSYFWIVPLLLYFQNISSLDFISFLLKYKDLSIFFAFIFIVLSYPLGIVVNYISYYFADKFIYKFFVYRKEKFNKLLHKKNVKLIQQKSSERINLMIKEKTQELSILGSSALNFFFISLSLLFLNKLIFVSAFTFVMALIFFNIAVLKYKSWYHTVEENVNV